jgi:uncharacterized membrane protein
MDSKRAEAFSDGVFAVAITLLVLELLPIGSGVLTAGVLLHAWPEYFAYVVSFLTIGIMWLNHHTVMDLVVRVDRRFLLANLGLLMCIAFVPFPTRLMAEHIRGDGAESAALAYGFTLTATALFFNAVWFYAATGGRLLRDDCDPRVVAGISRTYGLGPAVYLGATLVALASPTASALLFLVIAALYILESSIFGGRQTVQD